MEPTSTERDIGRVVAIVETSPTLPRVGGRLNVEVHVTNHSDRAVRIEGHSFQLPPGFELVEESPGNEAMRASQLQPGDSCSLVFVVRANGVGSKLIDLPGSLQRVRARRGEHSLSVNLRLRQARAEHWLEARATLTLRPAPSEIYASAVGAAIVASVLHPGTDAVGVWHHLLSGALGFILVGALKRRRDLQVGLAVEDGVGGAVVGFLAGYGGMPILERLLGSMLAI